MVNQEKINEWTAALRSGKYKQATGVLAAKEQDTYCCLGLLCVLNGGEVVENPNFEAGFLNLSTRKVIKMDGHQYDSLPPIEMVDALGLDRRDAFVSEQDGEVEQLAVWDMYPDWGDVTGRDGEQFSVEHAIAALNDSGFTFEQIADIVDYFGVR